MRVTEYLLISYGAAEKCWEDDPVVDKSEMLKRMVVAVRVKLQDLVSILKSLLHLVS